MMGTGRVSCLSTLTATEHRVHACSRCASEASSKWYVLFILIWLFLPCLLPLFSPSHGHTPRHSHGRWYRLSIRLPFHRFHSPSAFSHPSLSSLSFDPPFGTFSLFLFFVFCIQPSSQHQGSPASLHLHLAITRQLNR
ncbi:hypothetical protein B0H65DRAFT_460016 [Neurospora tetraspora]|uniref:Uncharacterized protein n=1 Tax=Neurospora tetraspora TaxID=94610 RepID=A0AAE0JM84_9PEZI|nr:hypothetical protein B0H65DRAFT_460016 [Neurospora tetraspora]